MGEKVALCLIEIVNRNTKGMQNMLKSPRRNGALTMQRNDSKPLRVVGMAHDNMATFLPDANKA